MNIQKQFTIEQKQAEQDNLANMYCLIIYDGTNFVLMNPRAL